LNIFLKILYYKKKGEFTVLKKIEYYINKFRIPKTILTDNGGEFINKSFIKYFKGKDIILIHGKPPHYQTQRVVER